MDRELNGLSVFRSRPWEYERNQTDGMEADNEIRRHVDEEMIAFFSVQSHTKEERSE